MTSVRADIVAALLKVAENDHHIVRGAAMRALGRSKDAAAVPVLLMALREKAGLVYDFAIQALAQIEDLDLNWRLIKLLQDDDPDVRRASAIILGARKETHAVPLLMEMLADTVPAVGHAAAEALGQIGDHAAVPALVKAIENPHADWPMCINVADALGKLQDASAAPALIHVFMRRWDPVPGMNATPPVRKHILDALVSLGEPALPALLAALKDEDIKVRHGVVEAIGHLIGE